MHTYNAYTHTLDFFQVLFNIFMNALEETIQFTVIKFSDDTKLEGYVDMLEGSDTIQRYSDCLEKCTSWNLMKCSRNKCRVLPLGTKTHTFPPAREMTEASIGQSHQNDKGWSA